MDVLCNDAGTYKGGRIWLIRWMWQKALRQELEKSSLQSLCCTGKRLPLYQYYRRRRESVQEAEDPEAPNIGNHHKDIGTLRPQEQQS